MGAGSVVPPELWKGVDKPHDLRDLLSRLDNFRSSSSGNDSGFGRSFLLALDSAIHGKGISSLCPCRDFDLPVDPSAGGCRDLDIPILRSPAAIAQALQIEHATQKVSELYGFSARQP